MNHKTNDSTTSVTPPSKDLVQHVEFDRSNGTAVVTVLTHGGSEVRYRLRTEENVNAAMGRTPDEAGVTSP